MLILKRIILDVRQFCITDENKIYYVGDEKIKVREVFFEGEKIIDKTRVYSLVPSSKGVFINTINGAWLFNGNAEVDFLARKIFKGEMNSGFVIEEMLDDVHRLKFLNLDQNDSSDLGESSAILYFTKGCLYQVLFDENLGTKSLVMTTVSGRVWECLLKDVVKLGSDEVRIKTIIGVLNKEIWIALNNHTVIALNIETGELTKQLSSIPDFKCDWLPSAIPAPEAMKIDERRNCLVGLMWEFYWEINPESGKINFFDLSDYFKKEKIRNDKPDYVLVDKHIYFISRHDSKLGALNLNIRKLDWVHTFKENEKHIIPEIQELQGNDVMLGALDKGNTLYIFGDN